MPYHEVLILCIKLGQFDCKLYKAINFMADRFLEKPRQLILSEISRLDIRIPTKQPLLLPYRRKKMTLPPLHNQSECRRFKTEQSDNAEETPNKALLHLKHALRFNNSDLLNHVSERIRSLEKMGLVQGGAVRTIRYSGHIKIPTVHNDYHNSKTNGGFSRNKYGGLYPK